jgi:hypothetical protein
MICCGYKKPIRNSPFHNVIYVGVDKRSAEPDL